METVSTSNTKNPQDTDLIVARRLLILRRRKGMSQQELASQLNISYQQLYKYERGINRIPAGRLRQISKILNTPINAFFEENSFTLGSENAVNLDTETRQLVDSYRRLQNAHSREMVMDLIKLLLRQES